MLAAHPSFVMLPMKFIHVADIHLDSPLAGLAAYKDAPADRLRTVTRDAFTRLHRQAFGRGQSPAKGQALGAGAAPR